MTETQREKTFIVEATGAKITIFKITTITIGIMIRTTITTTITPTKTTLTTIGVDMAVATQQRRWWPH